MEPETSALLGAFRATRLQREAFAALIGVAPDDVRAWEAGEREAPAWAVAPCARALSMTVEQLFEGSFGEAPVPQMFLRAVTQGGDLDQLLGVSVGAALNEFVTTARAVALLANGGCSAPKLPRPPSEAVWAHQWAPDSAREIATWLRAELGITGPRVPSMRRLCEDLGVVLLWADQAEIDPSVDGASLVSPRPTILTHLVEGASCWWRTRMTLAHELCHVLCDFSADPGDDASNLALVSPSTVGDDEERDGTAGAPRRPWRLFKRFNWIEQRASAFASHFLVPDEALQSELSGLDPTYEVAVERTCQTFGVGRITAVSRIKHVFNLSEATRSMMLRRAHIDRHDEHHEDVAPPQAQLRGGLLLDEVAAALCKGAIDRVEARRLLDLRLTDPLPPHKSLSEALRKPLRVVEDDVRALAQTRLLRSGKGTLRPAGVFREGTGWRVTLDDRATGRAVEETLTFSADLERERRSSWS